MILCLIDHCHKAQCHLPLYRADPGLLWLELETYVEEQTYYQKYDYYRKAHYLSL